MMFFRILLMLLVSAIPGTSQAALGPNLFGGAGELTGSFVSASPASMGGELGAALLVPIVPEKGFWIGPRMGAMWEGGPSRNHLDLQIGAEGVLWFVNALGVGLEADVLVPNNVNSTGVPGIANNPIHYRTVAFLSARLIRFQKEGAWAFRAGIPFDTLYHWGIQLGVSLQLSGVPSLEGGD